jgi:hypothetical protein
VKYDSIKIVRVSFEIYLIASFKRGYRVYNVIGEPISSLIFSNFEHNKQGELILYNNFNRYKLYNENKVEKIKHFECNV